MNVLFYKTTCKQHKFKISSKTAAKTKRRSPSFTYSENCKKAATQKPSCSTLSTSADITSQPLFTVHEQNKPSRASLVTNTSSHVFCESRETESDQAGGGTGWRQEETGGLPREKRRRELIMSSLEVEWAVACCQYCGARAGKVPGVLMKTSASDAGRPQAHCLAFEENENIVKSNVVAVFNCFS